MRLPESEIAGNTHLISNARLGFRCLQSGLRERSDGTVEIDIKTAAVLGVKAGDEVRYVEAK